ncbi:unnamed protein product [Lupinus luteus]|uniref:Heparan-alpha-glucosaminide N-acetyltransferase catalytic domain-containing protein n=1 Tax=Lupinus luteus TaxID=3873 RepID=A0AAV1X3Z5_LUPLU
MVSHGYQLIKNCNEEEKVHSCYARNKDIEMAMEISDQKNASFSSNMDRRLVSLDVFRGLTVALMILVDHAGGIIPEINHSPWNGLTLADYVMPCFLFIVGVSLALTYKKLPCRVFASRKAIFRALKLFALGLFLQGGFFHGVNDLTYGVDIKRIRLMGILQVRRYYGSIDIMGMLSSSSDTFSSRIQNLRFVALFLTCIYLCLLYGSYVPDWEYQILIDSFSAPKIYSVKCGVRANTGPACNAVGMIDREILGIQHLYRRAIYSRTHECSINSPDYGPLPPDAPAWCQAPFDPEGLLSSMMAIVTCFVGLHYGHIIVHFKDHRARILYWMIPSFCLVVFGLALDLFGMHINKALYTFSYMCVTAGAAGILFVGIYFMVDVCRYSRVTIIMEWIGRHALMIYILAACNILPIILQGFYLGKPRNNIVIFTSFPDFFVIFT